MSATEPDDELLAAALGAGLTYSRAAQPRLPRRPRAALRLTLSAERTCLRGA